MSPSIGHLITGNTSLVNIRLSGTRLSNLEKKKLAAFREGCGPLYCRHACGICEPKCPPPLQVVQQELLMAAEEREKSISDYPLFSFFIN